MTDHVYGIDPQESDARCADVIRTSRLAGLKPPPILSVSQWADRYRILSREASAEPGRFRTDRAPYQRAIMDAFSDPEVEHVVFMKSAQVGATEILNNVVGFYIHQDPAPMLMVQPSQKPMAEAWSKDRFDPMIRDTPQLKAKVSVKKSRDSGNTILHKTFEGGHLTVAGANSAAGMASRPLRVVLFDEVDRYPASAGREGDPIALGKKRTETFWNRKIGEVSTPTVKGLSRIEESYQQSNRQKYHVPCPHCEHMQELLWANVKWEDNDPRTAHLHCASCGCEIDETEKLDMLTAGAWIAENPDSDVQGFHISALYSPWRTLREIVQEFLMAKGNPERLKAWVNLELGETWEEAGEEVDPSSLKFRREAYKGVPMGVGVLTASIDVQGDRLEWVLKGWGRAEESWLIEHAQIWGDPAQAAVWDDAFARITKTYDHESGAQLGVMCTMVDSGGHHTEMVYRFAKRCQGLRVWACKGWNVPGRPLVGRPSKNNKAKVPLVPIGTDTAKDLIFARLKIQEPGPGYIHLPMVDDEYIAQLTSERAVTTFTKGRPTRVYKKTRPRNEALDLEVYALAALAQLGPQVTGNLGWYVEQAHGGAPETPVEIEDPKPARTALRQRGKKAPGRKGWVGGWKD